LEAKIVPSAARATPLAMPSPLTHVSHLPLSGSTRSRPPRPTTPIPLSRD
jgi:hypothetical protein